MTRRTECLPPTISSLAPAKLDRVLDSHIFLRCLPKQLVFLFALLIVKGYTIYLLAQRLYLRHQINVLALKVAAMRQRSREHLAQVRRDIRDYESIYGSIDWARHLERTPELSLATNAPDQPPAAETPGQPAEPNRRSVASDGSDGANYGYAELTIPCPASGVESCLIPGDVHENEWFAFLANNPNADFNGCRFVSRVPVGKTFRELLESRGLIVEHPVLPRHLR